MANITGTAGNDGWNLTGSYVGTIDGLGGVDALSLGTLNGAQFSIKQNTDGSILLDTVSGASGQAASHITLKNMEILQYNSGASQIDLTTYFPTVTAFSPADGGINAAINSDIALTFNDPVQRGAGNISIHAGSVAGTVIETFSTAASALLSFSGNTVTINPTNNLAANTHYFVTVDSGAIQNTSGRAYIGTSAYNFTTGNQQLGTVNNDTFISTAGNDSMDGGGGIDTVVYSGLRSSFSVTKNGSVLSVADGSRALGTDTLTNIERLKFNDVKLAMDLDGNAGTVAKILGAVFGIDSISNKQYVGIGLSALDSGMSYSTLMGAALTTAGATSNDAVVTKLWTNIMGVAPTASEKAPFLDMLNKGLSVEQFGVMAAEASYNTSHINLTGLIQTGIEYL